MHESIFNNASYGISFNADKNDLTINPIAKSMYLKKAWNAYAKCALSVKMVFPAFQRLTIIMVQKTFRKMLL